jgi:type IV pilus assembly protein PilN
MIRINLLPIRAVQRKERLRGQVIVLALFLILVSAGCAAAYASIVSKLEAENQGIARTQDELNQLRKDLGEVAQYKKLQGELQGKLDVLAQLKSARSGPVRLLDDLSNALPERLWLTSYKETGGSISISGVGLNEKTVAEFLRDLEASPSYRNVELRVIEQITQGDQRLHKFDLTCRAVAPSSPPQAPTPARNPANKTSARR